ncbi:hypothetical protein FACS1894159_00040 [Bacteroidia bacterium]|nr:hypothetical protein FACS1894159_00040 [Bacteroidia bacterium]
MAMAVAALVLTGCNCTKNMMKMTGGITAESNPSLLVQKGDKVPADITVKFAPKTFDKKTTLKITPALVFNGGELLGEVKYVQGESVKDNYQVIKNAAGGQFTFSVSFPYDARAKVCTLELRIEGKCKTDYVAITKLPIAKGISSVQDNVNYSADLKLLDDNFKKTNTISQSAQIVYEINKSNVRKNQLSSSEIKQLADFVKANSTNQSATLGSIQSKGYASPDGPVKLNDDLSNKRSRTAKDAVSKSLGKSTKYDISAYGEDWDGFQQLVQESNMKDKELVLQVLKMYSSSSQRDQELHNMSAVFKTLATDILPKLRRTVLVASADVKGKSDAELLQAAQSDPSTLDIEEALYIAKQLKDSQGRIKVYQAAANKSGDARAYNNLAVELAKTGNTKDATTAIKSAASKGSNPTINDNLGLLALQSGDLKTAQDALSKSSSSQAKADLAFANGDYAAASKGLTGYNLAVAQLCNGDVAAAKSTLASVPASADTDYLKAIVASRQGDAKGAIANLKSAIQKNPALKDKAKNDAEFTALFALPDFNSL